MVLIVGEGTGLIEKLEIKTASSVEMKEITGKVEGIVKRAGISEGICYLFVPHTTAAVTINENADRDVKRDMLYELDRVIPIENGYHHMEGNSAAHIKASLIGSSETVIVHKGKLLLGRWQGIFFCEFDGPRERSLFVRVSP